MDRVRSKTQASVEIEAFFRNASVTPDDMNGYLESVESAPIQQKTKLHNILLRPQADIPGMARFLPELAQFLSPYEREFVELAEINMKYAGYILKEEELVAKMTRLEDLHLHADFDYKSITGLSIEARDKLSKMKPRTIGQASRISGVNPADVSVLLVHLGR
jgi:tRNA uridine 5-carboxymethylaminomethyl modification enzyme